MKALMMLGAIIGFLIGSGFGLAGHSAWPEVLWRACAGALMAALLTRWWGGVWLQGLREALEARRNSPSPTPADGKPGSKL